MINLDQWQRDVINCTDNIALRSGRQVGKSTAIAYKAGRYAVNNPNKSIMIIAAVERQAYLLFEKVMSWMEEHHKSMIVTKGKSKPTRTRLKLRNGSIIRCLPAGNTGQGIRGFTIDLLIADEAAFIPDLVFSAITPALATKYKQGARIILLSTPFGRDNYFARAFNDPTFKTFHVSAEDCPRHTKEFLEQEKGRMTELEYRQEYLGEFVDELMQFFPDWLIERACTITEREQFRPNRHYFLGVDIARLGKDETTFEVIRYTEEELYHVENVVTTQRTLKQTTDQIIYMNEKYNFKKIFIDEAGVGAGVFENLMETKLKNKVIPINNAKKSLDREGKQKKKLMKQDLYQNLKRLMESNKIHLLKDPNVFSSLKSVQYEYKTTQKGEPTIRIHGKYTHIAEGLIRAAWCVKYKHLNMWLSSIKIE